MSTKKYLDENGLSHFWSKVDDAKVDKVTGKQLSTEDYTTAEKTKLSSIATGAEVNVIENISVNGVTGTISGKTASVTVPTGAGTIDSISVNGTTQTIDQNKNVDITVPTKVSDLTNDSGYQTASNVSSAISGKLDTSAVKTSQTTSDSDTYSCTYVNGEFDWIQTWCNLLDSEVQSKLNKTAVKTSNTTSDSNTYSCTYINNQLSGKQPLVNYSTSEVDTGVKWIDGKTIYRKVFTFNKNQYSLDSGNNWYAKTITHNLNISTYTNVIAFTKRTNNTQTIIPNGNYGSGLSSWSTTLGDLNTNNLNVRIGTDEYSMNSSTIVIIEYTKN